MMYYFLAPIKIESVVYWSNLEMEILMYFYMFKGPLNPKITFLTLGLCACVSVISITQKQIAAEPSNLAFYICVICRCDLKLFVKIEQKLCVQGHTKEFLYIKAYGRNLFLVNFRIFRIR